MLFEYLSVLSRFCFKGHTHRLTLRIGGNRRLDDESVIKLSVSKKEVEIGDEPFLDLPSSEYRIERREE